MSFIEGCNENVLTEKGLFKTKKERINFSYMYYQLMKKKLNHLLMASAKRTRTPRTAKVKDASATILKLIYLLLLYVHICLFEEATNNLKPTEYLNNT
jgi:hypothetical protein